MTKERIDRGCLRNHRRQREGLVRRSGPKTDDHRATSDRLEANERRSFGNLCDIRAAMDATVTPGGTTDDLVTLRLTREHCGFLLALLDREIREHA